MSTTSPLPASKHAWREVAYRGLPRRPSSDRVKDFLEIYGPYDEATAREQASRCIQCPDPSCVNGCPVCNPIPQWIRLTAEGRFDEAASLLGSVTNLAEICARLCPQERLCEETCLLNSVAEPVAIASLEQFLMEYALAKGQADISTPPPTGKTVAVIGSGPGALACADQLAGFGHSVTIFDSGSEPGGVLVEETPPFKLERAIIQRRVDILKKRGVKFRLGPDIATALKLPELRTDFDAVYLSPDARKPQHLQIPGADLPGVVPSASFIALALNRSALDLHGKRVLVIGGGDTAMDCLRTAIRAGAATALCVYRRGEEDMPCTPHDFNNARDEGAEFNFHTAPLEFLPDQAGHVRAIRAIKTHPGEPEPDKRHTFSNLPGSEHDIPGDFIVTAIGSEAAPPALGINLDDLAKKEGLLSVDFDQASSLPGIYAGGDVVRGPCILLHSIRDARRAALAIDRQFRNVASG